MPAWEGVFPNVCPLALHTARHVCTTAVSRSGPNCVRQVKIVDDEGNLVSDAEPVIMLQLARGKGNLGGTLKATAVNGVARFEDVTYDRRDPFTVTAVSDGLKPSTFPEAITLKPKDDFVVTDAGSVADEVPSVPAPPPSVPSYLSAGIRAASTPCVLGPSNGAPRMPTEWGRPCTRPPSLPAIAPTPFEKLCPRPD